jgi:hypothetical protein
VAAAALLAAAGCGSPRVARMDAEIERYSDSGQQAYQRGAPGKAADYYRKALARARETDLADEVARNSYNLALCLAADGQWAEARALIAEARRGFGADSEWGLRTQVLEARWCVAAGRAGEARALAQAALDNPARKRQPALEAEVRVVLAESLLPGDHESARRMAQAAEKAARRSKDPAARAEVARVQARLAASEGRATEAARLLDQRADWLQAARDYRAMAVALAEAGDAYQAAGNAEAAVDRGYRAARSAWGAGDAAAARRALAAARRAAQGVSGGEWTARLQALEAELPVPAAAGAKD